MFTVRVADPGQTVWPVLFDAAHSLTYGIPLESIDRSGLLVADLGGTVFEKLWLYPFKGNV